MIFLDILTPVSRSSCSRCIALISQSLVSVCSFFLLCCCPCCTDLGMVKICKQTLTAWRYFRESLSTEQTSGMNLCVAEPLLWCPRSRRLGLQHILWLQEWKQKPWEVWSSFFLLYTWSCCKLFPSFVFALRLWSYDRKFFPNEVLKGFEVS